MNNTNSSSKVPLWYITWWGFMLGSLSVGIYILFKTTGWIWKMWSPAILVLTVFFIFMITGFLSIYAIKKKFPGFYPFRRVFAIYLWITFVATLMLIAHDYWFHFIAEPDFDLNYLLKSKEELLRFKQSGGNISEEQFQTILKNIEEGIQTVKNNPSTLLGLILGRFKYTLVYTMISGFVITTLMRDIK